MPLGPLDNRTRRLRCTACFNSHLKCSGQNPCAHCQRRGIECSFSAVASKGDGDLIRLDRGKHKTIHSFKSSSSPQPPTLRLIYLTRSSFHEKLHHFGCFVENNKFSAVYTATDIQGFLRNGATPYLLEAAMATGGVWSLRSRSDSNKKAAFDAIQHYSRAVTMLREHMAVRSLQESPMDILWTTFFLGLFELIYNTSGVGWLCHFAQGTSKALLAIGPSVRHNEKGRTFFLQAQTFEVCRAIIYNEDTFLTDREWTYDSGNKAGQTSHDELLDVIVMCSRLRVRTGSLIRLLEDSSFPVSNEVIDDARRIALEGSQLRSRLLIWELDNAITDISTVSLTDAPGLSINNKHNADIHFVSLAFLSATSIYLSGIFDYDVNYWHAMRITTPVLTPDDIQRHSATILEVTDQALRQTQLSPLLFLFPLRVAGARARDTWARNSIRKLLLQIARQFAVAETFLQELAQLWEWRDAEASWDF